MPKLHPGSRLPGSRAPIVFLYAGFALTGALTVLLGCMLPAVAAFYRLVDRQAGFLLMVQLAASACAALLVRKNYHRTLVWGYALIATAALLLTVLPPKFGVAVVAGYGVGIGLAMTSTSMLVGRLYPEKRGSALSFLNFFWSLGATIAPLLISRIVGQVSLRAISIAVAILAAPLTLLGLSRVFHVPAAEEPRSEAHSDAAALAYFSLLIFLYCGVETSTGSWITTYVSRVAAWSNSRSDLVTACFWGALLLGRGTVPILLRVFSEEKLHFLSVTGAVAGVLLLVAAHTPLGLLAAAVFTGLALSPIFSLTLSLFMARAGQPRNSGIFFATAGFGAAVIPWLTGTLSTAAHSLRIGLAVPLATAVAMLLTAFCRESSTRPSARSSLSPHALSNKA